MFRKAVALAILIAVLCVFHQSPVAQSMMKLTDQRYLELAIDMIRKGVQQEDTTKILMVMAPRVLVEGSRLEERIYLSGRLQAAFDNSSTREQSLARPAFARDDNPLHNSNFWDFDILNPRITIEDDSAIVDCELVLWGAPSLPKSQRHGRRMIEKFIFKPPPEVAETPILSAHDSRWPATSGRKTGITRARPWQLVGCESLLKLLENCPKSKKVSK